MPRSPPAQEPARKKLLAALALVAAFAVATAPAVAQKPADPKPADPKKPDDTKKPDPKAAKGTLVVKPDAKGKFRLYVKDADGKTLLMTAGGGFDTEKEAKEAFEEIKGILAGGKVTVEKADEKEKDK